MTDRQVTSLADWREGRQEGELLELPTGNIAQVRRVHIMDLVEQGGVPDTLTGLVAQMIANNPRLRISMDDLQRYAEIVNLIATVAFVDPKVADESGEDCLGVQEVDFADRAAVFQWCHLSTDEIKPFRPEQE